MLNKAQFQAHPYHLVTVSPWPLIMSWGLLCLTATAVIWIHNRGGVLALFSLLSLNFLLYLWLRDVSFEGTYGGDHCNAVAKGLNLGVVLFLVGEILFFLSIFWAYSLDRRELIKEVFMLKGWFSFHKQDITYRSIFND